LLFDSSPPPEGEQTDLEVRAVSPVPARKPTPRPGPSASPGVGSVGEPAPKSSTCDRCGDVFNNLTDELAYYARCKCCQSCGAGPHWEKGADSAWVRGRTRFTGSHDDGGSLWIGLGAGDPAVRLRRWRKVELQFDTSAGDGFYDIDGTWLPADEILGAGQRNYGRKRAFSTRGRHTT
jgi:hypothetical protein